MKTILSKNNNGIVVKRGGKGFSPSVVWNQIEKEVISLNSKIDSFDRSGRGNSFYLEFKINAIDFTLRISDHEKRSEVYVGSSFIAPKIDSYTTRCGTFVQYCEFEILDSVSKKAFIDIIKSI